MVAEVSLIGVDQQRKMYHTDVVKRLAGLLAGLAVLATVGGVVSLRHSRADVASEVGKWLLALATTFAVAGAVSVIVKALEVGREKRAAWEAVLQELVTVNQTLVTARLILQAQRTVMAYQDQFAEMTRAWAMLRGIQARRNVSHFPGLQSEVEKMQAYLDNFGEEYQKEYLLVALQQCVDEEWFKQRVERAVAANETAEQAFSRAADERELASYMLYDEARFPRLTNFLIDKCYDRDFRVHYKEARRLLEKRIGFGHRQSTSE